ncbi:MAG TPA: TIGR00282 family metallophosphoesterase [Blastocatellia bacterium]|nr:TIGR00282 family metallophosphoesterase [Blastocatellia bacterium]
MRILLVGDIVGRAGRRVMLERLAEVRREYELDLVVANVENAAGGFSITPGIAEELFAAGVDVMTSGNHIYDKKEIFEYIASEKRLLRPANYPPGVPGSGLWVGEVNDAPVAVLNLQGRVFMPPSDDPFRSADQHLATLRPEVRIILVDVHAEATAEKVAMGRYLDGRVSAVVGTHTHVQTADEQILPGGTAYLTDLGMTGPHDGVIGMQTGTILPRFLTGLAPRMEPSEGDIQMNGLIVDVDEQSGKAFRVERLSLKHE